MSKGERPANSCLDCIHWCLTEGAVQDRVKKAQNPNSDDPENVVDVHTEIKVGECRRRAPQQMYDQIKVLQGQVQTSALAHGIPAWQVNYIRTSSWPVTLEDNWCGEWKSIPKNWFQRWAARRQQGC